jgi:hypothetical protein
VMQALVDDAATTDNDCTAARNSAAMVVRARKSWCGDGGGMTQMAVSAMVIAQACELMVLMCCRCFGGERRERSGRAGEEKI